MRYRLGLSLLATVIALCIGLPAVSSSSAPADPREDQQSGNTLCRAALSVTHHMIGFPALLRMLGRSDADLSVFPFEKWNQTAGAAPATTVSRLAPDGSIVPAQIIDVSVGP